ncbi:MAG: putative addiction module antidote protein [Acidocella sp.]|jgi:probable addiction module antidote protein|nr:putative addiction module antidote protein [Acidocella sp.]
MAIKTKPFDAAEYLDTEVAITAYLEDAFSDGDPAFIAKALGTVARARGMSKIAKATGVTREALYASLSATGNPTLATLVATTRALGYELTVKPLSH